MKTSEFLTNLALQKSPTEGSKSKKGKAIPVTGREDP
jgi:hypothetical protein